MSEELKPCPFCGGEAKFVDALRHWAGNETSRYFSVVCTNCGAQPQQQFPHTFATKFNHSVQEYRDNPALRARCEDEYDVYIEEIKKITIHWWNRRA